MDEVVLAERDAQLEHRIAQNLGSLMAVQTMLAALLAAHQNKEFLLSITKFGERCTLENMNATVMMVDEVSCRGDCQAVQDDNGRVRGASKNIGFCVRMRK